MRLRVNGYLIEGTPEEFAELLHVANKQPAVVPTNAAKSVLGEYSEKQKLKRRVERLFRDSNPKTPDFVKKSSSKNTKTAKPVKNDKVVRTGKRGSYTSPIPVPSLHHKHWNHSDEQRVKKEYAEKYDKKRGTAWKIAVDLAPLMGRTPKAIYERARIWGWW